MCVFFEDQTCPNCFANLSHAENGQIFNNLHEKLVDLLQERSENYGPRRCVPFFKCICTQYYSVLLIIICLNQVARCYQCNLMCMHVEY